MTSQSQQPSLFALDHPAGRAANRTMQIAKIGIFAISLAAAIPTARNLYYSYQDGIPFSEVSHRLDQYDLWMKNIDCRVNYRTLSTSGGTTVDVGTCKQSGDIAIKITSAQGQSNFEWIDFNKLPKPTTASQSAGVLGLFVSSAFAGETITTPESDGRMNVAQATIQTVCQARAGTNIVRITKDGDKCYREVVSPLKGTVNERKEVPCNTQCTPSG